VIYAGIDPLTGKERYLRESAPTRKEAQAALARLQTKVDEKRHPRTNTTMGALLDPWMEVSDHDESTAERYADLIRIYLRPTFGATPAGKIDAEVLELFYARLRRCRELCTGRAKAGHSCRPLAANTVRKLHFIVRAALGLGVRWRHLGVNEAEIARPPTFERHEPDPPSADEAAALLNEAASDPEWCLFLWLLMVTGTRRGEMCALRWTDIDLTRKVMSVTRATSGQREKDTKTHQGRRLAIDDRRSRCFAPSAIGEGNSAPPSALCSPPTASSSRRRPTARSPSARQRQPSVTGASLSASVFGAPACTPYVTTRRRSS
jgi:integrase